MKSLRWFGKLAAVLSALILVGGYVASRAMPGLLHDVQVFGGEGGGQAVPAQPAASMPPAGTAARVDPALLGSSKEPMGVFHSRDFRGSQVRPQPPASAQVPPPSPAILPSSKGGLLFSPTVPSGTLATPPAQTATTPAGQQTVGQAQPSQSQSPQRVVVPDGTFVIVPPAAPAQQSVQGRLQPPNPNRDPTGQSGNTAPNGAKPPSQSPAPPAKRQQILGGSKSAPVFQ
jgi:hypothetical protein